MRNLHWILFKINRKCRKMSVFWIFDSLIGLQIARNFMIGIYKICLLISAAMAFVTFKKFQTKTPKMSEFKNLKVVSQPFLVEKWKIQDPFESKDYKIQQDGQLVVGTLKFFSAKKLINFDKAIALIDYL